MKNFETIIGYTPGVIGRVAELHAKYYAAHWNFGHFFEAKVATDLSGFISNYESKDRIWTLSAGGSIEGSLAIDGTSEKENIAHLRWFIISDKLRGKGSGNRLMEQAVFFCKEVGFEKIYLWTFQGLSTARHLYEKFGFRLVEEHAGEQWGTTVTEQRFELVLGVSSSTNALKISGSQKAGTNLISAER
jgi:N-acetylglutamate synthase-like GNAT family acetyltransferase